jgi:hypothetical protein
MEGATTTVCIDFNRLKLSIHLRRRAFFTSWSMTVERKGWVSSMITSQQQLGEFSLKSAFVHVRMIQGEALARVFAGVDLDA